jgi:hypothetical protein
MIDLFILNLAKDLYEERLQEAARSRRRARSVQVRQPPRFLRLRLWAGERLIRLGKRLKTQYPASPNAASVGEA